MHSWFHLLLLFFSLCFFFILFDPRPMRKQHLDLWTSHMLLQWKRLQGEWRDSKGSSNKNVKRLKATNKLASGPQLWPSLSQMRNLVLIVLSEILRQGLHMGIKCPTVLAPVVHQSHWFCWKAEASWGRVWRRQEWPAEVQSYNGFRVCPGGCGYNSGMEEDCSGSTFVSSQIHVVFFLFSATTKLDT